MTAHQVTIKNGRNNDISLLDASFLPFFNPVSYWICCLITGDVTESPQVQLNSEDSDEISHVPIQS